MTELRTGRVVRTDAEGRPLPYLDAIEFVELGEAEGDEDVVSDGLATLLGGWQYEETAVADIDSEMRRWGVLQG